MRARRMMRAIAVLAIVLSGFTLNWTGRIGEPVGSALGQSIPANTRNTGVRAVARVMLQDRNREWQEESDNMAFVTNTWRSVNGDASDANSWSGGVPAANDVCVFDDTSQQSMTTGLGDVDFEQLLVKPSYQGTIGFPGNPWRIGLATGVIVYRGAGQAYINPEADGAASVIVDVDRSLRSNDYSLFLGGMGAVTQGNVSIVAIKRGKVRILGDMNFGSSVYVLGSGAELLCDADLAALNDPPDIFATAGFLENRREVQANAFVVVGAASKVIQVGALPATAHVIVIGNGKFQYVPIAAPGTTPTLSALGGVFDQSNEQYDNTWGTTIVGPDASIIGGTIRGTAAWPPSYDLREEYPGPQE